MNQELQKKIDDMVNEKNKIVQKFQDLFELSKTRNEDMENEINQLFKDIPLNKNKKEGNDLLENLKEEKSEQKLIQHYKDIHTKIMSKRLSQTKEEESQQKQSVEETEENKEKK